MNCADWPGCIQPPTLHGAAGIGQVHETTLIQALAFELAVEALDKGILDGLARVDKAKHDS